MSCSTFALAFFYVTSLLPNTHVYEVPPRSLLGALGLSHQTLSTLNCSQIDLQSAFPNGPRGAPGKTPDLLSRPGPVFAG